MKKLIILFSLALISGFSFAQVKNKTDKHDKAEKAKPAADKYHDNIDDRMKGPNGEEVYIGANGGRYYMKNGKKVYLPKKKK